MNQCYGCTTCESADKPLEGFVQTDRAESHRMPREESAVQMQIRSLRETFFVR